MSNMARMYTACSSSRLDNMILQAISIGYAVPRVDFDVVVHSVFQSAVNIKPKGENRLLTLLASGEADLPQGIRLDTPDRFSFEELPIGIRGKCQDNVLNFENYQLTIDLRKAKHWEGNLSTLQVDMTNPAVIGAWQSTWQVLNHSQISSGAELIAKDLLYQDSTKQSALVQRVSRFLSEILAATKQYDLTKIDSIEGLIGLGTGLTPSGDDILLGYLAGLWCFAKGKKDRLDFLSALGETTIRLSNGTNDISRTYLYHAAHGYVSNRLYNLAYAICAGLDSQRVCDYAEAAMQAGHTSGMDAVTGLLFGLSVWGEIPLE